MFGKLVRLIAWIETFSFLIGLVVLVKINYYPMLILFLTPLVVLLGISTLKLNNNARRLNLLLSPVIVFVYASGLMMVLDFIIFVTKLNLNLNQVHFLILFIILLINHIYIFSRPQAKELFTR